MPLTNRLFPGDEELGKRDDDHKPRSKAPIATNWRYRRFWVRRNGKRIFLGWIALTLLYLFFKNMPTDLQNPSSRPRYIHEDKNTMNSGKYGDRASTKAGAASNDEQHWFNGPIKFYQLAATLRINRPKNPHSPNLHVLFASSSLKSASEMIPLACEMASWKRNSVHFALMGRDDITIDDLKAVNGADRGCDVHFHDARPDFSAESSDFRMEISSSAALSHINSYIDPQAVIIDCSKNEDAIFLRAFRERAAILDITLIEVPTDVSRNLMWLTRLDSLSLKHWNKVNIDILIHAQPSASGSLIRLLRSLSKADYFKSAPPRLTIELPHDVDEPTRAFLESFNWPPSREPTSSYASQLFLHHRIPQHGLTVEENSIRLFESFWPTNPSTSHVLILSPQVELSPIFFQYLKYTILEYKYGSSSSASQSKLLGISLDLPSTYLNDTTAFTPPPSSHAGTASPFLWQAPNSNAALYFGDKWVELHSFVSHSLASSHVLPTPTTLHLKQVAKTFPSWLEHILRFVRARGYYTLYPSFVGDDSLTTVHNDLYQPPEEFTSAPDALESSDDPLADADSWTVDPMHHLSLQHTETTLASTSLLNILFPESVLPTSRDLPALSWDGLRMNIEAIVESSGAFSAVFRREVGGCKEGSKPKTQMYGDAGDLFCLDDNLDDEAERATPAPSISAASKGEAVVSTSTAKGSVQVTGLNAEVAA